ncbi:MAG: hypothetical protein WBA67_12645 [Jannaschia sp.]
MSRLILHIGTHKTATTSIQKFLFKNRAALAERGVLYPDYGMIDRKAHYAQLGMVNALSGRHRVYPVKAAETFFSAVRKRSADFDTTIISAEPFYRHVLNDPEDSPVYTPEDYWPLRTAYIAKIRDIMGEAEVVVVFRRQADYAQSLYQEHMKTTRYMGNFQTFLQEFWFHFVFRQQAEAWNAAFPGLRALSFDKLLETGDVVAAFARLLGLPVQGFEPMPRANEGLPVDLVILKRMLHRTSADRDALRQKLEALQARLPAGPADALKARSFFKSLADMKAYQAGFAAENEGLRRFIAQDIGADEPLFRTDFKRDGIYGDKLKPAVLEAMLDLSLSAPAPGPALEA